MIKKLFAVIIAIALMAAAMVAIDSPKLGDGEAIGVSFLLTLITLLVLGAGWQPDED